MLTETFADFLCVCGMRSLKDWNWIHRMVLITFRWRVTVAMLHHTRLLLHNAITQTAHHTDASDLHARVHTLETTATHARAFLYSMYEFDSTFLFGLVAHLLYQFLFFYALRR